MLKEGQIRIPAGCAISGLISKSGRRIPGNLVADSMKTMHDRSNGLGGGFAGYGIYPEYKDLYAFHIFYDSESSRTECEKYLNAKFEVAACGKIPVRKNPAITDEPLIWRYFLSPLKLKMEDLQLDDMEYVARVVMKINTGFSGSFVFSSGKNMGCFKAVGFPEDIGNYYRLEEYEGYSWTAHGRYPTNTPGWWGGAHPFGLLDYTIVHNGEISSYDANRRFIEMFGYKCSLQTDTEVIAYIADFLIRKKGMTLSEMADVVAAPFWTTIETKTPAEKERLTYLRCAFSSLLITGPFSIILGFDGGLMALNDRLKLRSMVIGEKDDMVYMASEECAIRKMEPNIGKIWSPKGGEPVIVRLDSRKEE